MPKLSLIKFLSASMVIDSWSWALFEVADDDFVAFVNKSGLVRRCGFGFVKSELGVV